MLPFSVEFKSGLPPSDQLLEAVRRAIATGALADGAAFPSVRAIARELRISPTTVHKAVAELREEGLLFSQPGVGMSIRAPLESGWKPRLDLLQPLAAQLAHDAAALDVPTDVLLNWLRDEIFTTPIPGEPPPCIPSSP